ncbi:MAG: mechanosensitive ion channel family protein [Opitutaceae bacterium]
MIALLPTLRDFGLIVGVTLAGYVVLVALAHLLRRNRALKFGWTYHAFALLSGLLVGVHLSSWREGPAVAVLQHLTAAVLLFSAFPLIVVCNRIFWNRTGPKAPGKEVPRVLTDTTGLLILLLSVLVALQFVYHVEVPGLLAGSGVVAIIVGLAMQDLLGNLIAGIGLHFDKSFTTGDWLQIEGTHAKVIELSWRTTRLITNDDVMIDVPNSNIVKAAILNFEKPTRKHAVKPLIGLHYDIPPAQAQRVLQAAAASVPGVCQDPAPVVYLKEFADSAIIYEINVWIEDHGLMDPVMSDVRVHCWYAAKRAGFEIPYPQMTLHQAQPASPDATVAATATAALRSHPVFRVLTETQIVDLLAVGETLLFAATEPIVTQGETGASMFLVVRGHVEVVIARDGQRVTVATLNAGDCFGEMSLLTGEPRTASVVAQGEVTVVEITKEDFGQLARANPDLLARVSEMLAQRQLANEKLATGGTHTGNIESTRGTILKRLRVFFQLGT